MTGRPRVLHVTTTDISLALLLLPQLRAFADAGFEVIGASAPGPHVRQLTDAGIRHVALRHATRAMAPAHDLLAFAELRSVFRHLRPDIVHTHNPKPGIYGRIAARSAGVAAVVNTVHGLYALPEDRWSKRAAVYGLERLAAGCSAAELVQNPEDLDVLDRIGVPADRLVLLGNGIDLERFDADRWAPERAAARRALGVRSTDVVCGLVGRLVWQKGYREVFDAAARLRQTAPNVRFIVVGPPEPGKTDGVEQRELERAADEAGVQFLGLRLDVEPLYAAMDLYVLASHREGFPRSAMEASAMGLPVVATDIRGCRQVVDEGVTGLLVAVGDSAALADSILRLATDDGLRAAMGRAGRVKALRAFDQRECIRITLDVYRRLLDRQPLKTSA